MTCRVLSEVLPKLSIYAATSSDYDTTGCFIKTGTRSGSEEMKVAVGGQKRMCERSSLVGFSHVLFLLRCENPLSFQKRDYLYRLAVVKAKMVILVYIVQVTIRWRVLYRVQEMWRGVLGLKTRKAETRGTEIEFRFCYLEREDHGGFHKNGFIKGNKSHVLSSCWVKIFLSYLQWLIIAEVTVGCGNWSCPSNQLST